MGEAVLEAGSTTEVNLVMQVGAGTESLTIEGTTPQIQYESHEVNGRITRLQIDGLPVNGRNYLEFIKLEPGAQPPVKTTANRILMPLLGSPVGNAGRATRITVDGGSVMEVGNGGSALGFSQEVVQEFQVSTVNMDISGSSTASGAVNVATRSGTNELHGSGFFFFRDHHLAAYPALHRNPFNPDPFFQRKQFGLSLGGPLHKDRAFFFGSFERLDQRGVISTEFLSPDFAALSGIYPSPTYVNQISVRTDIMLNQAQSLFVRYSHEGNFSYAPFGESVPVDVAPADRLDRPEHCWTHFAVGSPRGKRSALLLLLRQFRATCSSNSGLPDVPGDRRTSYYCGRPIIHRFFQ